MDEIKIQNFAREHSGIPFPMFRSLSIQEAEKVRTSIEIKLGLTPGTSPLNLVRIIGERSKVISNVLAEDDNFNLKNVLKNLGIEAQTKVYINWYRFDKIDEMRLDDLSIYFDDIWYPAADALDVLDNTFEWLLCVDYYGGVRVLQFR